jgi:hypothetical protein
LAQATLFECRALLTMAHFYFCHSHRANSTAASIPPICARMNAGAPAGAIPANVSDIERAMVTAGLANEVEAVNLGSVRSVAVLQ